MSMMNAMMFPPRTPRTVNGRVSPSTEGLDGWLYHTYSLHSSPSRSLSSLATTWYGVQHSLTYHLSPIYIKSSWKTKSISGSQSGGPMWTQEYLLRKEHQYRVKELMPYDERESLSDTSNCRRNTILLAIACYCLKKIPEDMFSR